MDVETIPVELGDRSYSIYVGSGLLNEIGKLVSQLIEARGWRRAAVITDTNVGKLYAETVRSSLSSGGLESAVLELEPGERSKSVGTAQEAIDFLAGSMISRSDLVVALGGGVVGDLGGFAASVFKRGIDVLQVPTTLMAQVDSSIGGKTAMNLETGKNLVGTFHQPAAVICDVDTLETLSTRDYVSGLAEVAKYSFLNPDAFQNSITGNAGKITSHDRASLVEIVATCAGIKAEVVSVDERETGLRAVLNYGHTLGHALEAATEYEGTYTHGEAVSVGMVFAALVAESVGLAVGGLSERHSLLLESLGLPTATTAPAPPFETLAGHIAQDKKSRGELTMVLLEKEGSPVVRGGLEWDTLEECYDRLLEGV